MNDRHLTITGYESETAPWTASPVHLTWEALTSALSQSLEMPCVPAVPSMSAPALGTPCLGHDCSWKKGRAWSPVRLRPGADRRLNANVEAVTLVTFDADDVTNE